MYYYPRDYLIWVLESSKDYKQAIQRLKCKGFSLDEHYRWKDQWNNWITDDVVQYHFKTKANPT